jgi:hypothetical protein
MDGSPLARRTVLRVAGATALAGVSGRAAGSPAAAQESTGDGDYGPLGSVAVPGAKEAVVGGDHVFMAVGDGFAVVDIAEPTAPELAYENRSVLGDREDGPLIGIQDVKLDGDRLLVAGPANGGGRLDAFALYDVADPTAPERVGAAETEFFHHNVFLRDGYVYLTGNDGEGNPLVVYDAGTVEEVGRWGLLDADERWGAVPPAVKTLHDVYVQDGTAYLAYWDAGTYLVDVSEPSAPSLVHKLRGPDPSAFADTSGAAAAREAFLPPGNDHYAAVDEDADLLGIGMESWAASPDGPGGPSGIDLYDIGEPTAPERLTTIDPPATEDPSYGGTWTTAHNFGFAAGRLYSAWYAGGVRLFDLADPSDPEELRAWRDSGAASFWTARAARPGEFFVASSRGAPAEDDDTGARGGRLYTFPEPALPGSTTTAATGSTTGSAESGDGAQPRPVSTPGFGVGAALGALGLGAAYRLLGGRDGDDRD